MPSRLNHFLSVANISNFNITNSPIHWWSGSCQILNWGRRQYKCWFIKCMGKYREMEKTGFKKRSSGDTKTYFFNLFCFSPTPNNIEERVFQVFENFSIIRVSLPEKIGDFLVKKHYFCLFCRSYQPKGMIICEKRIFIFAYIMKNENMHKKQKCKVIRR